MNTHKRPVANFSALFTTPNNSAKERLALALYRLEISEPFSHIQDNKEPFSEIQDLKEEEV